MWRGSVNIALSGFILWYTVFEDPQFIGYKLALSVLYFKNARIMVTFHFLFAIVLTLLLWGRGETRECRISEYKGDCYKTTVEKCITRLAFPEGCPKEGKDVTIQFEIFYGWWIVWLLHIREVPWRWDMYPFLVETVVNFLRITNALNIRLIFLSYLELKSYGQGCFEFLRFLCC